MFDLSVLFSLEEEIQLSIFTLTAFAVECFALFLVGSLNVC